MPGPTTHPLQVCHNCGGGSPVDVHFCQQCTKILGLARQGDYFSFLGVPRSLTLDAADLEQRFRTLSRKFHPDYFYNAPPAERRASLERASYLNDAYRTLKNPVSRIGYLLELEGVLTAKERGETGGAAHVPPSLLEEVFALNEELDEVRALKANGAPESVWRPRLERAARPIEEKRDEHEADLRRLSAEWDGMLQPGVAVGDKRRVLDALKQSMLERNYIMNLLNTIDSESRGPDASADGQVPPVRTAHG
jgi:Fe-S protein assembly co-chaperone HscB